MLPSSQGALRLFRFAGIDVFLHWSWFLVAGYVVYLSSDSMVALKWNALAYASLFGIVLLHEFGHSLACRQVGGQAHQIILWPFGGIAFVAPPPRPGAVLWSIAAGPLVNVILAPFFYLLYRYGLQNDWPINKPDAFKLVFLIQYINLILLGFNMLPIYPLDGGQMLRALLWYKMGPLRSLLVATSLGFVGVAALFAYGVWENDFWKMALAFFAFTQCQRAWTHARMVQTRMRQDGEAV